MRIAYCEDEQAQAELAKEYMDSWAKKRNISCTVELFSTAEEFLFALDEAKALPYDLVLLDIAMDGMDGFTLAKKLRERDKKARIAFLTSDSSHVFEGYELEIWRYILKPLTPRRTAELLSALTESLGEADPYLLLEISGEMRKLYLRDLLYVEVNGHYTTLHGNEETITTKKKFSDMVEALNAAGGNFLRCHRSVAVNLTKIQRIGRQSCVLTGNVELPVSRNMYQALNEAFIRENL